MTENSQSITSNAPARRVLRETAVLILAAAWVLLNSYWTATVYGLAYGAYPPHILIILGLGMVLIAIGFFLSVRSFWRIIIAIFA